MAELLGLRGQRTAALAVELHAELLPHVQQARFCEPAPIDGGIAARIRFRKQLTILNIQETVDDQRGHVLEALKEPLCATSVEYRPRRVGHGPPDPQRQAHGKVVQYAPAPAAP